MSKIEWTDETWNPIVGCSKISAGCKNCYAIDMAARLEAMHVPQYQGLTAKNNGKSNWTGKVRFVESALGKPVRWRKPCRIFVNSMGDLFHPDVPLDWIKLVWAVMEQCPQHQFQILTKHPERMSQILRHGHFRYKYPSIFLGVSVENADAIERIKHLKSVHYNGWSDKPINPLFVSFEPLIDSVKGINLSWIDWAIVGGESGKNARPMNPAWVQEIYNACQQSGTAFFLKQWGAYGEDGIKRSKKANGRLWQGRTWDETPQIN